MCADTDPRATAEHVRRLPGDAGSGDVVVTGVVHDHPASAYRAASVVNDADPDVLALELPPMAVPLFERYAADRTTPAAGGEMSAAIRAATTDTVVGIDGPSPGFLWRLARTSSREGVDRATVRTLLSALVSATGHAVACRLAATVLALTAVRLPVVSQVDHGCDWYDDPPTQAADERTQIRKAESVLGAFGRPSAVRLRDVAREAHMADRLATLRREGTVVAVVGFGHLDPLVERLG